MQGSISVVSVLETINRILSLALHASKKQLSESVARKCEQAILLLKLVDSAVNLKHHQSLKNVHTMLRLIGNHKAKADIDTTRRQGTSTTSSAVLTTKVVTPHPSEPSSPSTATANRNSKTSSFPIECFFEHHLVLFQDIIGCEKAKQLLEENVVLQLKLPHSVQSKVLQGIRRGVGNVLLHGPPGTGKTLLAQAVANEAHATYITVRPSDILSKYQGDSEKFVHQLFEAAKTFERAVLFFDEFDSIATSRRSYEDNGLSRRLLSELLLQLTKLHTPVSNRKRKADEVDDMNSISTNNKLVVIAATNRIEDIDEAVIRRFESKVFVGVPNKAGRKKLIIKFLQGIVYDLSDKDLDQIGDITYGWSGSDIETVAREAAMVPFREFRQQYSSDIMSSLSDDEFIPNIRPLRRTDFELAATTIVGAHMEVVDEDDVSNNALQPKD